MNIIDNFNSVVNNLKEFDADFDETVKELSANR